MMRNKLIILLILLLPILSYSQYNRKKYREKGEVSNGLLLTIGGASFVTMGLTIRPLYYGGPNNVNPSINNWIKKPWYKQHHKTPPIIVGVGVTITGLFTLIAEK
jgi:hypothetical protein